MRLIDTTFNYFLLFFFLKIMYCKAHFRKTKSGLTYLVVELRSKIVINYNKKIYQDIVYYYRKGRV